MINVDDVAGFIVIFATAFVFLGLNIIAAVFLFVRIYIKWRNTSRLSMATKIPFYLGIPDAILCILQLINYTYTVIHHTQLPEKSCIAVAGMTVAATLLHRFMGIIISINAYMRVCWDIHWDFGKLDWKLWFCSGSIAVAFTVLGSHQIGASTYWCYIKGGSTYVLLAGVGASMLMLGVCTFCYFRAFAAIRVAMEEVSIASGKEDSSHRSGKRSQVEIKAIKKITGYMLMFIIQWFPVFPYDVYQALNKDVPWTYALAVASFNLGGVGYTILYVINEGYDPYGKDLSLDGLDSDDTHNASSGTPTPSSDRKGVDENGCEDEESTISIPLQELYHTKSYETETILVKISTENQKSKNRNSRHQDSKERRGSRRFGEASGESENTTTPNISVSVHTITTQIILSKEELEQIEEAQESHNE
ncbi:3961_t:CDS:2 [Acaulospora morrowiae]|uniref:3961_t:CDS:1 n=1 Tax=Acaulospora morrowiae TaxID=94023 RepID=A0A9N9D1G1_9GLOM|nr:3961_t:CDS:2 [Acaulospora morrowiae]